MTWLVDDMDRMLEMTTFVKVVDSGGFSAAARALSVSASVVTTHIQTIEDRLGVRLLNRTTRHVSTTEAGKVFYDSCVRILAEVDEAERAAQELQSSPRGTLRLNVDVAIPRLIAPVVAEFTMLHPAVSVIMAMTNRMVDLVEEGFDLAIRVIPLPDSSLMIRRLAHFGFVACGAPAYFARQGVPKEPADLANHNCMIYSDSPWRKQWEFIDADGKDLFVPISGNLQANNSDALRFGALHGQGLMYTPRFLVADDLKSGRLVPILTEFQTAELTIDAIYPHRSHLPAKVSSFIDLLLKHFREDAAWTNQSELASAAR
jgi:DNA-binding transcriptional LysR family regulator